MAANEKSAAESIVCFIEDQAFSPGRMIWLPAPPPFYKARPATHKKTDIVKEIKLADGRGRVGEETNQKTASKSIPVKFKSKLI